MVFVPSPWSIFAALRSTRYHTLTGYRVSCSFNVDKRALSSSTYSALTSVGPKALEPTLDLRFLDVAVFQCPVNHVDSCASPSMFARLAVFSCHRQCFHAHTLHIHGGLLRIYVCPTGRPALCQADRTNRVHLRKLLTKPTECDSHSPWTGMCWLVTCAYEWSGPVLSMQLSHQPVCDDGATSFVCGQWRRG